MSASILDTTYKGEISKNVFGMVYVKCFRNDRAVASPLLIGESRFFAPEYLQHSFVGAS